MEALHALEAEHDVFRTIGRVDDLDDVFTRLLVDHGTGEQAVLTFGSGSGERGRYDIRTHVLGIHLLYVVAYGLHAAEVVEPNQVGTPLPAFHVGEKRSVCSHVHDVGVAFQCGHESGFVDRSACVVPFHAVAVVVAGIFAGEHFRAVTVVVVIAVHAVFEPVYRTVEMFVHKVYFLFLHVFPTEVEHLAFRVGPDEPMMRISGWALRMACHKEFQAFEVEFVPLLVSDA
mgnify:CR=1 FL=1